MIKQKRFLQLDTSFQAETGKPKGIDPGKPCLNFAGEISKKYRAVRRFTRFPLYFLRAGSAGEAIIIRNVFSYRPILRYYPRLNFQWGAGKKIDRWISNLMFSTDFTTASTTDITANITSAQQLMTRLLRGAEEYKTYKTPDQPELQRQHQTEYQKKYLEETARRIGKAQGAPVPGMLYRSMAAAILQIAKTSPELETVYETQLKTIAPTILEKRLAAGYTFLEDGTKHLYREHEAFRRSFTGEYYNQYVDQYAAQFIAQYAERYAKDYTTGYRMVFRLTERMLGRSMEDIRGGEMYETRLSRFFRQHSAKSFLPRYTHREEVESPERLGHPELRFAFSDRRGEFKDISAVFTGYSAHYGTLLRLTTRMLQGSVDYIARAYTQMAVKGRPYAGPAEDRADETGPTASKAPESRLHRLLASVTTSFARIKEKLFKSTAKNREELKAHERIKGREEKRHAREPVEILLPAQKTTSKATGPLQKPASAATKFTGHYTSVLRQTRRMMCSPVIFKETGAPGDFGEPEETRIAAHYAYITHATPVRQAMMDRTAGVTARITVTPAITTAFKTAFTTALTAAGDLLKNTREQIIARIPQPQLRHPKPIGEAFLLGDTTAAEEWEEIAEGVLNRFTAGYNILHRLTGRLINTTTDNIAALIVEENRDQREPSRKPERLEQEARQLITRYTAYYMSVYTAAAQVLRKTPEDIVEHFKRQLREIRPQPLTSEIAGQRRLKFSWLSTATRTIVPGETGEPSIKIAFLNEIKHRTRETTSRMQNQDRIGTVKRMKKMFGVESAGHVETGDAGTRYVTHTAHALRRIFEAHTGQTRTGQKYRMESRWRQYFVTKYTAAETAATSIISTIASTITSHIKTGVFKYVSGRFTVTAKDTERGEETLKQRIIRTQTEAQAEADERAAAEKDQIPYLPGFDSKTLEKRYTAKLSSQPHLQQEEKPLTIENLQVGLPQQHWLSIGPKIMKQEQDLPPLERIWKEARQKDEPSETEKRPLEMLTQKTTPSTTRSETQYPGMTHRPPETHQLDETALKKIQKKIADETKQFKNTVEKKISTTTANLPKANLNQMADDVYNIILDKVKKERKMRGL